MNFFIESQGELDVAFIGETNLWIEFCNATKRVYGTCLLVLVTEVVTSDERRFLSCRRSDSLSGGSLRIGLTTGDDVYNLCF